MYYLFFYSGPLLFILYSLLSFKLLPGCWGILDLAGVPIFLSQFFCCCFMHPSCILEDGNFSIQAQIILGGLFLLNFHLYFHASQLYFTHCLHRLDPIYQAMVLKAAIILTLTSK